ncbi:MAG: cytochrome C oxidase subunit IV family protein [Phycisphaerae bacterium]
MAGAHEDAGKHVPLYIGVLVALVVGTIATVWVATVEIPYPWDYVVGLGIACVKASLVAFIFMHLKWERGGMIWWTLVLCALFFFVLLLLPAITIWDLPKNATMTAWSAPVEGEIGYVDPNAPKHDAHGHGHDDHGHDDHGHGDHGHDDHAHGDDHAHDDDH